MDQNEFENRLDGFADKMSRTVADGVTKMEEAFDKGKANVKADMEGEGEKRRLASSPRMGLLLVAAGLLWLLHSLGLFSQPVFPIMVVAVGIYLILRHR